MELIILGFSCFTGILGTYIKMSNDLTKIKSRVYYLERQEGEVKNLLKELCEGMQDIKILLAEKGIK
jgi:hypothetical protein|tara:strand:- start:68 stop:268 length:201 start_codon:yes stop_codon:yes gene_type:complete